MIEIRNLKKRFGNHVVFDDTDFIVDKENTINCIIGPSGAGKTTLFQIMFGLDRDFDGAYLINGINAKELTIKDWEMLRINYIQIVYQDFKLLENFTVFENMLFAANDQSNETMLKINELLKDMNLERIKNSKVIKISGGEKQRLALARALILDPKVILLDEPTGNLDNDNTSIIMEQIKKMAKNGISIIIITHDSRVIPYCDHIFEINHKKLVNKTDNLMKDKIEVTSSPIEIAKHKKEVKSLKYVIKRFKTNVMDLLLANLPIVVIFIVFISIFGLIYSKSIEENRNFYGGVKEDVIILSTSNYTNKYKDELDKKGLGPFNDGVRIGFSKKDLNDVKSISGVKDARLFNTSTISSFDADGNILDLHLHKRELSDYIKTQSFYSRIPDNLAFTFTSLSVPYDYIDSYNPKGITVQFGKFPSNNREILIPDILAYNYLNGNDLNSLIDSEIDLDVHNDHEEGVKRYIVSGIYKTNISNENSEVSIYVHYNEFDFLDLFSTKESYEDVKREYEAANGNTKGTVYENYDSYVKALGTNLGDMIIRLESPTKAKIVSQKLSELFPNLKQLSQYEFRYGQFKESYNRMVIETFGIILIIAICFGLIIVFINKNYIKNRNKEMAILYSLGYSKLHVIKIIIYEYLISTCADYLIAYSIIFLAFKIYFQSTSFYSLITIILSYHVFLLGYVFVFIMTVISVLFAIHGVKRKNLKRYLR